MFPKGHGKLIPAAGWLTVRKVSLLTISNIPYVHTSSHGMLHSSQHMKYSDLRKRTLIKNLISENFTTWYLRATNCLCINLVSKSLCDESHSLCISCNTCKRRGISFHYLCSISYSSHRRRLFLFKESWGPEKLKPFILCVVCILCCMFSRLITNPGSRNAWVS